MDPNASNPNFVVELFIKTLEIKHKLTFQKEKEEYFRVLFDTYLNGQGNITELRDYIAAGIENQETIGIIANQVIEWQTKAEELKTAEKAKKKDKDVEKEKIEQFVESRSKKLREEAEKQRKERKQRKEKGEEPPRKKRVHKQKPDEAAQEKQADNAIDGQNNVPNAQSTHPQRDEKGLMQELKQKGVEKCKFYPYCKNLEDCQFFHPTQRCTYFPNCRYGDGCLYEHESCRFKERCNRANCPYTHPFKKSNPIEQMMKSFMSQNHPLASGNKKKKPYNKYPKAQGKEQEHRQQK